MAIYQHVGKQYLFIGFDEVQQLPGYSFDSVLGRELRRWSEQTPFHHFSKIYLAFIAQKTARSRRFIKAQFEDLLSM